jgi:tRNA (guanine37-N1)-methyltransferase
MSKRTFDAITIFPDYFAPLELSLIGKAKKSGLIEIGIHDLRSYVSDNHKTVDDTPYGGGAGMVMLPEPWGLAIDDSVARSSADVHDLIVLTPAGERFTQAMAEKFLGAEHLIFANGRYEGIDIRVTDYYRAQPKFRVHEVSIGDYVLGGGEVATLVIMEAIIRLIPGVIGNPESLTEESHTLTNNDGALVEYPNYTKPPIWRGLEVPEILMSGNHRLINEWRHSQSVKRTEDLRRLTSE